MIFCAIAQILLLVFTGGEMLDNPVYCGGTDYLIGYDDGTAHWLVWDGLYRGVYFDSGDFFPACD